ncbi:MAG TPA: pentapeptide repeat-containing protein [Streptosporangiaceae bacterium]|nr:pentapeptide repeat-containing protein [Streptosporangiaceae bacterium]
MRKLLRSSWWIAPAVVVALAFIWAVLWPLTDKLAAEDVSSLVAKARGGHLPTAREAVRSEMLTLLAGVGAAGALVYTGRNFRLSRLQFELARRATQETAEAQRRTLELTEQGQVTSRYTEAIAQLGSDKLDIRIGGVYALERIARDSARDHPTVMEVLSAFIREHSREQWPVRDPKQEEPQRSTRPDVQAAVTVLARRDPARDTQHLDLSDAVLTDADLREARLSHASFRSANLSRAALRGADLTIANLTGADLTKATLWAADLTSAYVDNANLIEVDLFGANLTDADLAGADFTKANISGANLTNASFSRADLTEADLTDADLTKANLSGANLTNARFGRAKLDQVSWPSGYAVPDGWVRDPETGQLSRADASHSEDDICGASS